MIRPGKLYKLKRGIFSVGLDFKVVGGEIFMILAKEKATQNSLTKFFVMTNTKNMGWLRTSLECMFEEVVR